MDSRVIGFLKEIAISNDDAVCCTMKARAFDLALSLAVEAKSYRLGELELTEEKFRPVFERLLQNLAKVG